MSAGLTRVVRYLRLQSTAGEDARTDRELLEHFAASRDETAFEALVRRHGPLVLGVCRRLLRNHHDAEDAFQATFLVLARKADCIGQRELLAGWLHGVACRTARKARGILARAKARDVRHGQRRSEPMPPPGEDHDLRGVLDQELAHLPEKYRLLLLLCELEGRSRAEAALALGLPPGTVSSRLARGRKLLAERLTRRGFPLALSGLASVLAQARAEAMVAPVLIQSTVQIGLNAAIISARVALIAKGVISTMAPFKTVATLLLVALLGTGLAFALGSANEPADVIKPASTEPIKKNQPRSVIVLWMHGGPSQRETFDLKPGRDGGPIKPMPTVVKRIEISEHLPRLAALADKMVFIRSMMHAEQDHGRASILMHTGHAPVPGAGFPSLGAQLAKELGSDRPDVPGYVCVNPAGPEGAFASGFLGERYAPLRIKTRADEIALPDAAIFQAIYQDRAEPIRRLVTEAAELDREKPAARAAYGPHAFGLSCLFARRLVERQVPVIEIVLGGWDRHSDLGGVAEQSAILDAGWSALMRDLQDRQLLDTTLIVWAGEFGRTPQINSSGGRDHWSASFTAVLAGGGIHGGQVIGRTDAAGKITDRPVTVPEFLATIYRASGVDPAKRQRTDAGTTVPLAAAAPLPEVFGKAAPEQLETQRSVADRLALLPGRLLMKTDDEATDGLYLGVLRRLPVEAEKGHIRKHLRGAKSREEGLRDVLWSLINSSEFLQLHGLLSNVQAHRELLDVVTERWKK